MKALRILSRNIRDSFKGVFRNFSLSLASISCITITLVVVALSIVLSINVNNFTTLVEKDLINHLKSLDNLEKYTYHSKQEVTDEMKESSETFKSVMDSWSESENPLQPTFEVKVNDIEGIGEVAKSIKNIDGVETVKYGEGMIEQLITVFNTVRKIGYGVVAALILVTAFLITNTIKITIFSRKREIEIMRLVGASNLNIKIPFILEGLLLGVLGSIIPIGVTIYGYNYLYEHFNGQLFSPFIKLVKPNPFSLQVSGLLVIIGMLVGMFGSWRAVRKYLKI